MPERKKVLFNFFADIGEKFIPLKDYKKEKRDTKVEYNMMDVWSSKGSLNSRAIEYYEQSLKIAKVAGDKVGEAKCYTNLGVAYYGLGDFRKAIEYYEQSLEIAKALGDKAGEAACYVNLGSVCYGLGNFGKAIEYSLKAKRIFKELDQINYLKILYKNLSLFYKAVEDSANAEKYKK